MARSIGSWIVLGGAVCLLLGSQAQAVTRQEEFRALRAENKMLKAQIAALRKRLAAKGPARKTAPTAPAREAGIQTVNMRIGVVLGRAGGALAKMLLPFKLGLGGVIGGGGQYMSWIALDDLIGAIKFLIDDHPMLGDPVTGAVNLVAPRAVTNREFTKTLGKVLGRPTLFPMPAFAARLAFGEMADELLLASTRVEPVRLGEAGFSFAHGDLEAALRQIVSGG